MKADSLHPLVQKASALDARPPSQVIVPKLNADIWPKADILPFRKARNSSTGLHRADYSVHRTCSFRSEANLRVVEVKP